MTEILIAIFGVTGTIVTGLFTYKLGVRNSKITELKEKQDTQKTELANVDEGMRMWRELSERLEEKLKKSEAVNELYIDLKRQYSEILAQNKTLIEKVDHLERELIKRTTP